MYQSVSVIALASAALLFTAPLAHAQKDTGKIILLETGEHDLQHAPIALPCDLPAPENGVYLTEEGASKEIPATIRGGELVFVPDAVPANATRRYKLFERAAKSPARVEIKAVTAEVDVPAEKPQDWVDTVSDTLEVYMGGVHFTTYHYSNKNKKPFLWPVYAEGQAEVTRSWPMGPKQQTADHVHQKSMWTAYGDVNGVDTWTEGQNSGAQRTLKAEFGSGDAYAWIRADNQWQSKEGQPVVDESREYRFYAGPESARFFDVTVTFTAAHGDVKFGDTKEGGIMALRIRDEITEKNKGIMTLSEGRQGMEQCWGKPSPWCDYSGPIEGVGVRGAAIFDHPGNLRYPSRWHVRDYGLMGANVFGLSYFTEKEPERLNGEYTLKKGETLTFRYRVYVHSGDVTEAKVAERYANYIAAPKVSWAN